MKNCVIVNVVCTVINSFNGSLASISTIGLGVTVIGATIECARINSLHIDEVIVSNVLQAGLEQNPACQTLLENELAGTMCEFTVGKVYGLDLKNVTLATQAVQVDQAQSTVAGGMENMSLTPYLLDVKTRSGYRLGNGQVYDVILRDGLICATHGYHMGITAENVTKEYGTTREMQDELVLHSQRKAVAAIESGTFTAEIVPVNTVTRKKTFVFSQDEFPKVDFTTEVLGALRLAFDKAGIVTAGNTSGINDGAVALVIMEGSSVPVVGPTPLVHIKSYASGSVPPASMGIGPVLAMQKALQLAGLQLANIGLIETNGAFVVQFPAAGKALGFEPEKVNVNGETVALGHPIGASGAHTLVALLHIMQARDKTLGLATLRTGGDQGIAMVIKRLN